MERVDSTSSSAAVGVEGAGRAGRGGGDADREGGDTDGDGTGEVAGALFVGTIEVWLLAGMVNWREAPKEARSMRVACSEPAGGKKRTPVA